MSTLVWGKNPGWSKCSLNGASSMNGTFTSQTTCLGQTAHFPKSVIYFLAWKVLDLQIIEVSLDACPFLYSCSGMHFGTIARDVEVGGLLPRPLQPSLWAQAQSKGSESWIWSALQTERGSSVNALTESFVSILPWIISCTYIPAHAGRNTLICWEDLLLKKNKVNKINQSLHFSLKVTKSETALVLCMEQSAPRMSKCITVCSHEWCHRKEMLDS